MTTTEDQENPGSNSDDVQEVNRELYKRNAELAVRIKTLALLRKLDEISLSALSMDNMAREIVLAIAVEFSYEMVSVAILDEKGNALQWLALASSEPDLATILSDFPPRTLQAPVTNSLASVHILTGTQTEPVLVKGTEGVFPHELLQRLKDVNGSSVVERVQSSMIYPLFFEQKALGVLTFSSDRNLHELSKYEHESIEGVVSLTSLAMYKAKIYEDLQRTTKQLSAANKHLKELMDVKTEFLHIASHQLRTPLTSLRGFLEMQAKGEFDKLPTEERRELQQNMFSGATQLNSIVNDLLDAMELEGGSLNFKVEPVQLENVIEDSIKTLKLNYDKKGLSLVFEKSGKPLPKLEADPGYLRQVFLNIIDNAEKYTEKGGVTIKANLKSNEIEVAVTDTGMGIDSTEIHKLFGKFVRGKKSERMHTDGSGLGLFIIKKIVEEHNGRVMLESEGVGKGTTFRVTLPLQQPH
ncbi:MAG: GAF domain-containing sensor histidine kinase [Candidatus Andersenbacteria bacterium]|nr:GAF domain-containing sensor histidine kinase [Candidatus Andersenbacteria bacterium]